MEIGSQGGGHESIVDRAERGYGLTGQGGHHCGQGRSSGRFILNLDDIWGRETVFVVSLPMLVTVGAAVVYALSQRNPQRRRVGDIITQSLEINSES
jgi:hypothetical protein